jgi:ubiquinone/menaquinone biosynthesis C-methylase UbiE
MQTQALAALALTKNDVLLDLGCGTGAAVRDAAPSVTRAVGFDLSPGMIAQAIDRAGAAGLDNVEFHTGDVSARLPFEDGAFTALVCTTAFHHFPEPRDTINEMSRVLAPGGRLVIADSNRRHPAVFALDLVLRVAQPSHAGFRSPGQLMHDLCAAGFASVSYCTVRWRTYAFVRGEKALG